MATFGKTTTGDTAVSYPTANNVVPVCQFTLSDNNASISKMTVYGSVLSTATEYKGLIFADSAGNPTSVLAVTLPASVLANTFIDLPFSSNPVLNSGVYWLGLFGNGAGTGTAASATGTNRISGTVSTYPTITGTFSAAASTVSTFQKTIYATYTVQATDGFNIALI